MSVINFPAPAHTPYADRQQSAVRRTRLAAAAARAPADPIFAAIEAYEAADIASNDLARQEPSPHTAAHQKWNKVFSRAMDAFDAARDALLRTRPSTRVVAVALIGYVLDESTDLLDHADVMTLLETLRAALPNLK